MKRVAIIIAILFSNFTFSQRSWQLFDDLHTTSTIVKDSCLSIVLLVDSTWEKVEIKSNCLFWELLSFNQSLIVTHDTSGTINNSRNFLDAGYCNCESCSQKSRTFYANDSIRIKTCHCTSPQFFFRLIKAPLTAKQKKWRKSNWKAGDHIDLENLLFYPNKNTFLPESFEALDSLTAMLKKFPTIIIEIQGHVNGPKSRNTEEFVVLSESRAKSVFDYLIENGISSDRLVYKGYGNTKMRFPKSESKEEMESNRRVEILILSR